MKYVYEAPTDSNPIGGFAGSVNLAASGMPTGVSAAFGQNPTSTSSTLTLAVGASVAAGTYPITVTGTSGSLTHMVTVTLTITTGGNPDYSLVPNATALTIPTGGSATDTITVVPSNGWTSSVALTATSATGGITASMSTSPVAVNGTSTLTVTVASSVAPGNYSVTVNGMSGSQSGSNNHSISIPVTVTGGGGSPDFTLSANPASVTVAAPGSGTTTITVNPVNGFTGSVALSASGLPAGVTASFNPASTTSTSVLTFTADGTAAAETYPVTVTGTSSSLAHTVAVSVTVTAGGGGGTGNFYLAVYATSANSTRIYWEPIDNAVSYKIYRTTTTGGEDFTQPVATVPPVRPYHWDDSNLQQGTDYFYVIRAVLSDGSFISSDEDDDVPSNSAIPWNGTTSAILSTAYSVASQSLTYEDQYGGFHYPDYNAFSVLAPDGQAYTTSQAQAAPNQGAVVAPAPPPGVTNEGSGAVRRLGTKPSNLLAPADRYDAVRGTFYLPPCNQADNWYLPAEQKDNNNHDIQNQAFVSGHVYVGFNSPQITVDGGVQCFPEGLYKPLWAPAQMYKKRWSPVVRVNEGRHNRYPTLPTDLIQDKSFSAEAWVDADSMLGSTAVITVALSPNLRAFSYLAEVSDGNKYVNVPVVVAYKAHSKDQFFNQFASAATAYRMKRVISVDQRKDYYSSTVVGTSQFTRFNQPFDMFGGAFKDGSRLKHILHNGELRHLNSQSWSRWTSDQTDLSGSVGANNDRYPWKYQSTWFDTLLGPVNVGPSPLSQHEWDEEVNIELH